MEEGKQQEGTKESKKETKERDWKER
jgi:hypothetical protein